ncbi:hypothetical protein ACJ72_06408 [Emergomyces africanus]|uniref:Uncharacterized protein n=1 Tax=Emergomyces africanus TaxID=1955775 RepID=A0A1B7NR43_9EURO|nr:hypothetical protein ACJ72_06408 [Emergomyces africanus]
MPSNSGSSNTSGGDYSYKSSGGNHYCARDYGSGAANSNSYHYSNTNPNGSTYYNSGNGSASYTPPSSKK